MFPSPLKSHGIPGFRSMFQRVFSSFLPKISITSFRTVHQPPTFLWPHDSNIVVFWLFYLLDCFMHLGQIHAYSYLYQRLYLDLRSAVTCRYEQTCLCRLFCSVSSIGRVSVMTFSSYSPAPFRPILCGKLYQQHSNVHTY